MMESSFRDILAQETSPNEIIETKIILKEVSKCLRAVCSVHGRGAEKYIIRCLNIDRFTPNRFEPSKFMGIILYFDFNGLYMFLREKTIDKKCQKLVNHALKFVHREIEVFRGRVFVNQPGSYYAIWRYEEENGDIPEYSKSLDHADLRDHFKKMVNAKAEMAMSAVFTASVRVKILIREYMHCKKRKFNFKTENLLNFVIHAGKGFEGVVRQADKIDFVAVGRDLKIAKLVSRMNKTHRSDFLVTETVFNLLSKEVISLLRRRRIVFYSK